MNSVLQCIMNTPEFNDAFIDNSYTNDLHPRNKGIAKEYSSLIQRALETPNFGAETPSGLKRAIGTILLAVPREIEQSVQWVRLARCSGVLDKSA
jgi:ubiquitin C-terminal hydrolase